MKILTLKDQKVLSDLFKELVQRKWKKSHVDTSLVEEYMRVTSFSLEQRAVTKAEKKEVFDASVDLVKQIALHLLSENQFFNPLVILASEDTLFLCEVKQSSTYDSKKFSLIGKYAKKYKCFSAVFAGLSLEGPENSPVVITISLAYDESLTFSDGGDTWVELHVPKREENNLLEFCLIDIISKDPIFVTIIENIRKPDAEIVSLNSVSFN